MTSIIDSIRAAEAEPAASNHLPVLVAALKEDIMRGKDADYDFCVHLAEMRALFPHDNNKFGDWLKANGIKIEKNLRMAAIAMGAEPEKLRRLLDSTARSSLRTIYDNEWGVPTIGKTPSNGAAPTKKAKPAPSMDKAIHVIERKEQAGETITREDIVAEAGVGEGTAQKAMAAHKARAEAEAEPEIVLKQTAQERFDAKVKAHKKKLDLDFETAVQNEVKKRLEELSLPSYFKKQADLKALLDRQLTRRGVGIMTRPEFNAIRKCLHPDWAPVERKDAYQSAFVLLTKYEDKLVFDKDLPVVKEFMRNPATREEMTARKKKAK